MYKEPLKGALSLQILDQMMKPSVLSSPEQDILTFKKRASHTFLQKQAEKLSLTFSLYNVNVISGAALS